MSSSEASTSSASTRWSEPSRSHVAFADAAAQDVFSADAVPPPHPHAADAKPLGDLETGNGTQADRPVIPPLDVPTTARDRATPIELDVDVPLPQMDNAEPITLHLNEVDVRQALEMLSREQRCAVIGSAMSADGTTRKLYSGAIYLTQVACYAGIYDDAVGCPAIGWEGRYRRRRRTELTYPNPDAFLSHEVGVQGNYA